MKKYDKANLLPLTVSAILVLLSACLSYLIMWLLPAGVICVTAGIVSIVLNIKWNVDMSFHISEYIIANGISFLLVFITYAVSELFGFGLFALAISAIIIPMLYTRNAYEKKAAVVMILSTPVLYFITFLINGIVVLYGNYLLEISKA